MSLLGFVNFWIVQWFFIRIAFVYDKQTGVSDPGYVYAGWKIMIRTVPMTGWWSSYKKIKSRDELVWEWVSPTAGLGLLITCIAMLSQLMFIDHWINFTIGWIGFALFFGAMITWFADWAIMYKRVNCV